jgi:hypothetical protein
VLLHAVAQLCAANQQELLAQPHVIWVHWAG